MRKQNTSLETYRSILSKTNIDILVLDDVAADDCMTNVKVVSGQTICTQSMANILTVFTTCNHGVLLLSLTIRFSCLEKKRTDNYV